MVQQIIVTVVSLDLAEGTSSDRLSVVSQRGREKGGEKERKRVPERGRKRELRNKKMGQKQPGWPSGSKTGFQSGHLAGYGPLRIQRSRACLVMFWVHYLIRSLLSPSVNPMLARIKEFKGKRGKALEMSGMLWANSWAYLVYPGQTVWRIPAQEGIWQRLE